LKDVIYSEEPNQ
jgi:serine/threonine protein kinase